MNRTLLSSLFLSSLTLGVVGGCAQEQVPPTMSVAIEPSHRHVYVGETVTVFSHTTDAAATDTEIKWHTSGGTLTPDDHDRIARVKFDTPGTYYVDAMLMVNGSEARRDSTEIDVSALP
jgi:plastocyanin